MREVAFIVNNQFIENGGRLKRQKIGIPMGAKPSPDLTDLNLYKHEANFIDSLVQTNQVEKAKAFHMTFRRSDDLLCVDNPFAEEFFTGAVYPPHLQLVRTAERASEADFIGMKISTLPNKNSLDISIFDKRDDFPFEVVRYPFLDSNVPLSQCYGVFVSLLNRFHDICSAFASFLHRAVLLADFLLRRSYSKKRLISTFHRFIQRGTKYQVRARKATATFLEALSAVEALNHMRSPQCDSLTSPH